MTRFKISTKALPSFFTKSLIHTSPRYRLVIASSIGLSVFLAQKSLKPLSCAPTFNGVPVSASFLMDQGQDIFNKQFPGLEMSAVFAMNNPDFSYEEYGLLKGILSDSVMIELPLFEKLSQQEESRLGTLGIKKKPVGTIVMQGKCSLNCAQVTLTTMTVKRSDGQVVWEWKK